MNNKSKGISMALIAAILWGISGNFAEYIFTHSDITDLSYTTFRMLFSGLILVPYSIYINGYNDVKKLMSNKKEILKLIIYSVIGVMLLQTTFAKTIEYSNAPFTTLLQFLSPIIILILISIKDKKLPLKSEVFLSFVALFGMFLMVTNGNLSNISVSPQALIMGIISAMTFVFYIIYIKNFFKYDMCLIVGLGMLLGSVSLAPFTNHLNFIQSMNRNDIISAFAFNVILGNVIPFYFFLESTRYIRPNITAIIGLFEPITALLISVFIMKTTTISFIQIIGVILIIGSVTLLSVKEKK